MMAFSQCVVLCMYVHAMYVDSDVSAGVSHVLIMVLAGSFDVCDACINA